MYLLLFILFIIITVETVVLAYVLNTTSPFIQKSEPASQLVASYHRAFSSPSLYFGPFATMAELRDWANQVNLSVSVTELIEPTQWAALDYTARWSYPPLP